MKIVLPLIVLFIIFSSCKKDPQAIDLPEHLIGKWEVDYCDHMVINSDSLFSISRFDFELVLNSDGTGTYGFKDVEETALINWSTSFDQSLIFLSIEDTFDPDEKDLTNYRMEVLENMPERQFWQYLTARGGAPGRKNVRFWDMVKK